jgi:hypothetical protein
MNELHTSITPTPIHPLLHPLERKRQNGRERENGIFFVFPLILIRPPDTAKALKSG